jgi:hypothetical protein
MLVHCILIKYFSTTSEIVTLCIDDWRERDSSEILVWNAFASLLFYKPNVSTKITGSVLLVSNKVRNSSDVVKTTRSPSLLSKNLCVILISLWDQTVVIEMEFVCFRNFFVFKIFVRKKCRMGCSTPSFYAMDYSKCSYPISEVITKYFYFGPCFLIKNYSYIIFKCFFYLLRMLLRSSQYQISNVII